MAFEKIAITPKIIHDNANLSHSHYEEKIFQAIDHLKEVSHKRPDIDSIFDFINKSAASNITKESLEEIITVSKKSDGRDSFRRNTAIVNSTITDTQHQDTADPNTVKSNIEIYIESNVNTSSSISQKSSPEFTIDISPSNRIFETLIPSDTHFLLVASVMNDNFRLTQKNILKIDPQLSVLKKSYVDCELSASTSKIDVFSDSIKNVLSNLQNKEHKKSQAEVLKKNITFLQNEIKLEDTTIESLLETQNIEDHYAVLIRPNPQILSVDRQSHPATTATASGPLSTPSPTPATTSAKPRTEALLTVSVG